MKRIKHSIRVPETLLEFWPRKLAIHTVHVRGWCERRNLAKRLHLHEEVTLLKKLLARYAELENSKK